MSHCLSAAKNTVVKGLENVEAPEGGEALFECVLSQPEVAAHTWLLDDEPVRTSDNAEVVYFENGLRHLLLLKNLRPQDSCRVTFLAGDMVTSAFLTVRGQTCGLGRAVLRGPPADVPLRECRRVGVGGAQGMTHIRGAGADAGTTGVHLSQTHPPKYCTPWRGGAGWARAPVWDSSPLSLDPTLLGCGGW